ASRSARAETTSRFFSSTGSPLRNFPRLAERRASTRFPAADLDRRSPWGATSPGGGAPGRHRVPNIGSRASCFHTLVFPRFISSHDRDGPRPAHPRRSLPPHAGLTNQV